MNKKEKTKAIIKRLKEAYPESKCSLTYADPLQLMVATILSAQCTDERVNKVTPALFEKYPNVEAFASADMDELQAAVQSTGFFRNKAISIQESSREILATHGGEVPQTMADLVKLRGIGRKTANVVLGNAFGIAAGVVVDTHVKRLSNRLGLTKQNQPEKIEQDLIKLVPRTDWVLFPHLMIFHGRKVCKARKPLCGDCSLAELCPSRQ